MQYNSSLSMLRILRIITVVLGLIIVILGFVSHFDSAWTEKTCGPVVGCNAHYQVLCEGIPNKKCPKVSMERYFVAIIFICFILSIVSLALTFLLKENIKDNRIYKLVDSGYHVISVVLLFIGAVMYFVSAEQIHNNFPVNKQLSVNFRRPEKLAAASLTLFQAVLYGVTGFLIYTS